METAHETSLLAKALWSVAIILGLSIVAERISTRMAGLLSGAPLNTILVYLFVGLDMGAAYVVESVPHGLAAFTATLAFVLTYYQASLRIPRYTAVASSLLSVAVFAAVAWCLVQVPFTLASAVGVTLCSCALAIWWLRKIESVSVERPVRLTARILVVRGALAGALIVCVISLAESLGTRWTGLLAGFPTTLLPTLLIVHLTYGPANTHAMIRHFPIGMGSIVLYILSVPWTFSLWGAYGGTAASLAVSTIYLAVVMLRARGPAGREAARPSRR